MKCWKHIIEDLSRRRDLIWDSIILSCQIEFLCTCKLFWMTDFRTFNFGPFQVHILSLLHIVILEGKCIKTVSNQCEHATTIFKYIFSKCHHG